MKVNKYDSLVLIMLFIIVFLTFLLSTMVYKFKALRTYELYCYDEYNFSELNKKDGVTGLYVGNFFMVWVKDRSHDSVMQTCEHEWLHYMYYYDWEHFSMNSGVINE